MIQVISGKIAAKTINPDFDFPAKTAFALATKSGGSPIRLPGDDK